jgi:hypothetical protein
MLPVLVQQTSVTPLTAADGVCPQTDHLKARVGCLAFNCHKSMGGVDVIGL